MNGSATRQTVLCRLDELEVPDAKGFILGKGAGRRNVFVVRDASGIYAYENACPHSRGSLEWVPDQFLSVDRTHIQCTLHGSLFRIRDGLCISGPCVGESLKPTKIVIVDGAIVLME